MKKVLISISVVIVFVFIGGWLLKSNFNDMLNSYQLQNTSIVYTLVEKPGILEKNGLSNTIDADYFYETIGVKEDGSKVNLSFYGINGKPLEINTYLKVNYSESRGVVSWEKISASTIPNHLLLKLK